MPSIEDLIHDPSTVALIMERESVPPGYLDNDNPYIIMKHYLAGGYVILYLNENDVDKFINNITTYTFNAFPLVLGLLGEADLESAGILQVQRQPFLNLRGSGVLLGFVGTGIDYTQSAFRYEDGSSKIQYIWDQSVKGAPPTGYSCGSEWGNEAINNALASEDPRQLVPHVDSVGHGTFVASVAGGREEGSYIGAAPDSEFIVVKLKSARPSE